MKKTLTLLALTTAALIPMTPTTARADVNHFVRGIVFEEEGNWSTATGWYDANKAWDADDSLLCWAATCSNMIAWWQSQNGYEDVNLTSIWDEYRSTFENNGGIIAQGVSWWLDGTGAGPNNYENHLKPGVTDAGGAHYAEYLDRGVVESGNSENIVIISSFVYGAAAFSKQLVDYIDRGYCVGANFTKNSQGHAKTIWGVGCDENGLVTTLYMSDSDDHSRGTPDVPQIQIEPVTYRYVNDVLRIATANSPTWSLESVVVLNSRLSNDTHFFNILDEDNNIIMKQNVNGEGYKLTADHQEVGEITFDGSRGQQSRLLTVEGEHTADVLSVNGAGTNTINVEVNSKLTVDQISGGQKVTKTGAGMLEIHGGTSSVGLNVLDGDVLNNGALGEVTMNGGYLVNEGTATGMTLKNGGVAEMKRTDANKDSKAFTLCNIGEDGVLKGSGNFGKVVLGHGGTLVVGNSPGLQSFNDELVINGGTLVFSIDDALNSWRSAATETNAGWGSYTYSSIDMNNNSITLNPDEIVFALGETILKRSARESDLMDALDRVFTVSLSSVYFLDGLNYQGPVFTMAYAEHLNELAGVTRFKLSEDDEALVEKGLQAEITQQSVRYYTAGNSVLMDAQFNVKLAKAANDNVPEPASSTLSLLALAGFCARRRRK